MVRVKEEYDVVASPSFFNGSCDSYPKKSLSTLSYSSRRAIGPIRHSTRGRWTKEEDRFLIAAVQKFNCKNWKTIAACVPGKTDSQCLHRWLKVLDPRLIKGSWTKGEDDLLINSVKRYGCKWSLIAKTFPGRTGKQCRERILREPSSYEEATKDPRWRKAMEDELGALMENRTWDFAPLPSHRRPIGCKWAYKIKPDEKERVEVTGGRVTDWNGSCVLGVLATSRSIGDYYLKQYVMAEPEVTVSKRTKLDDFLVIASNGLWDALSNEVARQVVRRCLNGHIKRRFPKELRGSNATEVAAVLAELAVARGSQDNISVIVIELKKPN